MGAWRGDRRWVGPLLAVALLLSFSVSSWADDDADGWERERKVSWLNGAIVGGVAAYGFGVWNWGESSFRTESEGWFSRDTASGGADKLGHAYTGAVSTAIAASLFRRWGYDDREASRLGAFSGLLLTTTVELGDGFSPDHGFSWEDQVVNTAGVGLEYLRLRNPHWGERVQFRWEYFPSPAVRDGREYDLATDYSGSRWLLAFPLQAWGAGETPLRWVELQAGYGTRGYSSTDRDYFDAPSRHPFVGVGVHVPLVLGRMGASATVQRVFEYVQVPGTAFLLPP